jgi:hypothetical protein
VDGGKDGMDCSLCVNDFKKKKLYVSAAHNPVWIIRDSQVIELKADKMPVGKHDRDAISFTQHEIDIQKGDVIYTLTDGFPDQFGGQAGKKFMSKNLRELLMKNAQLPVGADLGARSVRRQSVLGSSEPLTSVPRIQRNGYGVKKSARISKHTILAQIRAIWFCKPAVLLSKTRPEAFARHQPILIENNFILYLLVNP